jgi:hypothetical protein
VLLPRSVLAYFQESAAESAPSSFWHEKGSVNDKTDAQQRILQATKHTSIPPE